MKYEYDHYYNRHIDIDAELAYAMWETCKHSIHKGKWTSRLKGLDEERLDEYDEMSVDALMALFDLEHIIMTYDIDWRIK